MLAMTRSTTSPVVAHHSTDSSSNVRGLRLLSEPGLPHRLTDQRADRRRIATPSYAHQAYLSPKFRLDDRQTDHVGVFDRVCRHECESQSGGDHSQGPVVALAPIDGTAGNSLLLENVVGIPGELAVDAMDIGFVIHLS